MKHAHARRDLVGSAIPDLAGKNITIVGNQYNAQYYALALQDAGANVKFVSSMVDALMPGNVTEAVTALEAATPKPDAVIAFHPRLRVTGVEFKNEPVLQLARATKAMGIPTLALDTVLPREITATERLKITETGMNMRSSLDVSPFQMLPIVAQMVADKAKPLRPQEIA